MTGTGENKREQTAQIATKLLHFSARNRRPIALPFPPMPRAKLITTGEDLRAARDRLGMTQAELADVLGTSRNTLSQWEIGHRPISKLLAQVVWYIERYGPIP